MADIYFATNRDVREGRSGLRFGRRFHRDGPQFFRVGRVGLTLAAGGRPGVDRDWLIDPPALFPESPSADAPVLGSHALFEGLRRQLRGGDRDVLIYIHGFASSFAGSALRAAQLRHAYAPNGAEPVTMFFSWPANGMTFPATNYFSDREDAAMSGLAMARALERLIEFLEALRRDDRATLLAARARGDVAVLDRLRECRRRISLVAHSMGNWALGNAVTALKAAEGGRRLPRLLDHVFLMAADADADALSPGGRLEPLTELAGTVHVYHAANDLALTISDRTKANPDRLGSHGPAGLDGLDPRVLTIDCAGVSGTRAAHGNHQYYRLRREVTDDVRLTLAGIAPDDPRRRRLTVRPGRSWRLQPG